VLARNMGASGKMREQFGGRASTRAMTDEPSKNRVQEK